MVKKTIKIWKINQYFNNYKIQEYSCGLNIVKTTNDYTVHSYTVGMKNVLKKNINTFFLQYLTYILFTSAQV